MCEYVFYCVRYEYSRERKESALLCVCCSIRARVPLQDAWAQIRVLSTGKIHETLRKDSLDHKYHHGACTSHKLQKMLVFRTSKNYDLKSNKMMAFIDPNWLRDPVCIHKMVSPMGPAPNPASPTCAGPRCAEIPKIDPCASHWPPASDHSVFSQAPFPPPSTLARSSSIHTYPRPCTPI